MSKVKTKRTRQEPRVNKYRTVKREVSIKPKTEGQEHYLSLIEEKDVVICNGLAGTGKTLLAVGAALNLMSQHPNKYRKLIMVRPYVTVEGENMGFLPGDIDDKMRPFVAPMFDSLNFFLNQGEIQSLTDTGTIEVIPIGFMRGRTFNNAIIIFDEAQNSRWSHMKMFLTRIGFSSKAIIEGDVTQSDLPFEFKEDNGLLVAAARLEGVEGIGIISLEQEDVVRSPIVKRILERLE